MIFGLLSNLVFLAMIIGAFRFFRGGGGGKSYAKRLEQDLSRCATDGLITADQKSRILAHLALTRPSQRLKGTMWLALLAGASVVLGISLIIAHNWNELGPVIRIVGFLLLLAGVGEASIRTENRSLALRLPLQLLWFFMPLLGIGLYGQTFHLSSDPIRPFLVWLLLVLPLAWWATHPATTVVHFIALVTVLFCGNFAVPNDLSLVSSRSTIPGFDAMPWLLSLGILAVITAESLFRMPEGHRRHVIGVWGIWLLLLLVNRTPFKLDHAGWICLAAMSVATIWLLFQLRFDTSGVERGFPLTLWLCGLYAMTFLWHAKTTITGTTSDLGMGLTFALCFLALVGVAILPRERVAGPAFWHRLLQLMFIAALGLTGWITAGDTHSLEMVGYGANVLMLALALGLIWHGALENSVGEINMGTAVLGVLLVTRFFDFFGTMLQSGLGFIISGIFLAGLAYALEKGRKRILRHSQGEL